MRSKVIKSGQMVIDCPAIICPCGGGCFGVDTGQCYSFSEAEYYCEDCGQTWKFPENIEFVIKFKKVAKLKK